MSNPNGADEGPMAPAHDKAGEGNPFATPLLAEFLEHMSEGMAHCRILLEGGKPRDFEYLRVNSAFGRLTGLVNVEGRQAGEIIPGIHEVDGSLLETYARVALGGEPARFRIQMRSLGNWFEVTAFSPRAGEFIALFTVISKSLETQEELRRSKERLELALKASDMGVWEWHVPSDKVHWSPECHRIVGLDPEELTLKSYENLMHPEDRESTLRRAYEAALTGREYTDEYRVIQRDGSIRWLFNLGRGILDEDGKPLKLIGTVQDVTQRKALEALMLRTQRLESVGRLAAGLAHDLNNDLVPIMAGANLLQTSERPQEDAEILSLILNSAEHGAGIIRNLLAFSRGVEIPLRLIEAEPTVREILRLVRQTFPRTIAVDLELEEGLPPILGDTTQLRQAVLNLCLNARDAMPGGGRMLVRLELAEVTAHTAATTPAHMQGPHLCIEVSDTGIGMTAAELEHIFDPFYTTKPMGQGSGLGLPSTLGIVRGHHGFVQVESSPGGGTRFRMLIPAQARRGG